MLAEKLKLPVVCPGELLRHEIELNTKIGKRIKPILKLGELVPSKLVEKIISQCLKKPNAKAGAVFDGYPRNREQLNFLIKRLKTITNNKDSVYAVFIDVSDKEIKQRLGGRRACDCGAVYHLKYNSPKKRGICDLCGKKLYIRDDDRPAVVAGRLKLYRNQTSPLLDYWQRRGKLIRIDGKQSIEKVQKDIINNLRKRGVI